MSFNLYMDDDVCPDNVFCVELTTSSCVAEFTRETHMKRYGFCKKSLQFKVIYNAIYAELSLLTVFLVNLNCSIQFVQLVEDQVVYDLRYLSVILSIASSIDQIPLSLFVLRRV